MDCADDKAGEMSSVVTVHIAKVARLFLTFNLPYVRLAEEA
jgi:hypothetical protein